VLESNLQRYRGSFDAHPNRDGGGPTNQGSIGGSVHRVGSIPAPRGTDFFTDPYGASGPRLPRRLPDERGRTRRDLQNWKPRSDRVRSGFARSHTFAVSETVSMKNHVGNDLSPTSTSDS
jgi:hypothetical protein